MSLQNAILGMLNYSPQTGYNLKTFIDKSLNHFWKASLSQIYRELSALEQNGYVVSDTLAQEERPDKKVYTITELGKNAFHEWVNDFPETLSMPARDEFLVRIFFGSQIGDDKLKKQFERYIEERKKFQKTIDEIRNKLVCKLVDQNSEYHGKEIDIEKEARYWQFTINRAKIVNESFIRWAEDCIEKLEEPITQDNKAQGKHICHEMQSKTRNTVIKGDLS
jgi:PadR family transcriptional regulator AphA